MDTILVVLIVGIAAAFIARKLYRTIVSARSDKAGCSSCGCGDGAGSDPLSL